MTRDLRKQALGVESGKTVSRKARSKQGTPSTSRGNSTAPSRGGSGVPSRNTSDDEDNGSDVTQWSTNSIDGMIAGPADVDDGLSEEQWISDLGDRMNEICDRKRSSVQGREETLVGFSGLLTRHYAQDELKGRVEEVVKGLLKSVKAGQTERETVLALKALALVVVTDPSESIYDAVASAIKQCVQDAQHPAAKVAGIHALSVATFYGGATVEETEEVMDFFLDIASSDGAVVDETDNAEIVAAALEEWGFLATQLEDVKETTEVAMDTFVDQLDSVDVDVQIAAGENIALLYEKSYTEAESDDEVDESDQDQETFNGHGPAMIKRYTVYRQQHLLTQKLEELAKASSKRLSKKDRKHLHLAFSDILNTVEKPTRGPRYSTALDDEGREFGSRMKIAISDGGRMTIDAWWKLHRLNGLKKLLQGGFLVHYEANQVVFDSLPVIVERE
jgi:hypothetical protein